MDPNATLTLIHNHLDAGETVEAAALFVALDAWLRRGGFMPDAWLPAVQASRQQAYQDGMLAGRRAEIAEAVDLGQEGEAYRRGQDAARGDY